VPLNHKCQYSFASYHIIVTFFFSIDCGNLLQPENGLLIITAGLLGNSSLFATATYTCDLGFNMSGSANVMCTNASEWLPETPNCTISGHNSHLEMCSLTVQMLFIDGNILIVCIIKVADNYFGLSSQRPKLNFEKA